MTGDSESVTFTAAVKGTAAYMPPEAINCDVSAKWDTWSYGVVILELITGEHALCAPRLDRLDEKQAFDPVDLNDQTCFFSRTGLPVMDRNREDHDLTTHVKNLAGLATNRIVFNSLFS